jgi:hypothetical protein
MAVEVRRHYPLSASRHSVSLSRPRAILCTVRGGTGAGNLGKVPKPGHGE